MSACCGDCGVDAPRPGQRGERRALWAVLAINLAMFLTEVGAGMWAGSTSLQADALDFLGDAANCGVSLAVVGMTLRARAAAALLKGAAMGAFGSYVVAATIWRIFAGGHPDAATMSAVGFLALAANLLCFRILWAHRAGDANMRSAWICTRNDVAGNLGVLAAALGVFGTGSFWPDAVVAAAMAGLALLGAAAVIRQLLAELRRAPAANPL